MAGLPIFVSIPFTFRTSCEVVRKAKASSSYGERIRSWYVRLGAALPTLSWIEGPTGVMGRFGIIDAGLGATVYNKVSSLTQVRTGPSVAFNAVLFTLAAIPLATEIT